MRMGGGFLCDYVTVAFIWVITDRLMACEIRIKLRNKQSEL